MQPWIHSWALYVGMTMESFTYRSAEALALPASCGDQGPRGPQQNREVEQERGVLHVEQIVFELVARLLARRGVVVMYLSPAGHARPKAVPLVVHRHDGQELVD